MLAKTLYASEELSRMKLCFINSTNTHYQRLRLSPEFFAEEDNYMKASLKETGDVTQI